MGDESLQKADIPYVHVTMEMGDESLQKWLTFSSFTMLPWWWGEESLQKWLTFSSFTMLP